MVGWLGNEGVLSGWDPTMGPSSPAPQRVFENNWSPSRHNATDSTTALTVSIVCIYGLDRYMSMYIHRLLVVRADREKTTHHDSCHSKASRKEAESLLTGSSATVLFLFLFLSSFLGSSVERLFVAPLTDSNNTNHQRFVEFHPSPRISTTLFQSGSTHQRYKW